MTGTAAALAAGCAGVAVLATGRPAWPAGRRLARLAESSPGAASGRVGPSRRGLLDGVSRQYTAAGAAGVAVAVLVGGAAGLVAAVVVTVAVPRVVRRLPPAGQARRQRAVQAALPLVLDLLAACLRAGLPWPAALDAAARAGGPALGPETTAVADALRRGAPADEAWTAWTAEPVLAAAGRSLARAHRTGAAAAPAAARAAAQARGRAHAQAEQRARAVAVWAVGPLMLCFLPAFVLVGVVPVVLTLLRALP